MIDISDSDINEFDETFKTLCDFARKKEFDHAQKLIEKKLRKSDLPDEQRAVFYSILATAHGAKGDYKLSVEFAHKTIDLDRRNLAKSAIFFYMVDEMRNDARSAELLSALFYKIVFFMRSLIGNQNHKGKEFFHYTSESILESIWSEGFHLYNTKNLTDTSEGKVFLKHLGLDQQQKEFLTKFLDEFDVDSYIYSGSFTSVDHNDNESDYMWEHYGKRNCSSEKGILVCWDGDSFSKVIGEASILRSSPNITEKLNDKFIPQKELFLFPVIYEHQLSNRKKLQEDIEEIGKAIKRILNRHHELVSQNEIEMDRKLLSFTQAMLDCFRFLFKSDEYSKEKEWRVFVVRLPRSKCIKRESEDQQQPTSKCYVIANPEEFRPNRVIPDPARNK